MNQKGFTLTEVMIAIMIFGIGILAASALQFNTLQVNKKAETIKELTQLATLEIEVKRQKHRDNVWDSSQGQTCDTLQGSSDYSCSVAVAPCSFDGTAFSCSSSVANPAAHELSVTVTDKSDSSNSFVLSTMVRSNN